MSGFGNQSFCHNFDPQCYYALGGTVAGFGGIFALLLAKSFWQKQRLRRLPSSLRREQLNALSGAGLQVSDLDDESDGSEGMRLAHGVWEENRWMLGLFSLGCLIGGLGWFFLGVYLHDFRENDGYATQLAKDTAEARSPEAAASPETESQLLASIHALAASYKSGLHRQGVALLVSDVCTPLGIGLFLAGKLGVVVHMAGIVTGLRSGPARGRQAMIYHRRWMVGCMIVLSILSCALNTAGAVVIMQANSLRIAGNRAYQRGLALNAASAFLQILMVFFTCGVFLFWLLRFRAAAGSSAASAAENVRIKVSAVSGIIVLLMLGRAVVLFLGVMVDLFEALKHRSTAQEKLNHAALEIIITRQWVTAILVLLGEPFAGLLSFWSLGRSRGIEHT